MTSRLVILFANFEAFSFSFLNLFIALFMFFLNKESFVLYEAHRSMKCLKTNSVHMDEVYANYVIVRVTNGAVHSATHGDGNIWIVKLKSANQHTWENLTDLI